MIAILARHRNAVHALCCQSCNRTTRRTVIRRNNRIDIVVLRGQDLLHVALRIRGQPTIGIGFCDNFDVTRVNRRLKNFLLTTAKEVCVRVRWRAFNHHVVAFWQRRVNRTRLHPSDFDVVKGQIKCTRVFDQSVIANNRNAFVGRGFNRRADCF